MSFNLSWQVICVLMILNHDAEFWPKYFGVLLCKSMVTVLLFVLWWICVCLHTTWPCTGEISIFLPRRCVFHNKPSSSHMNFCRGFHLRRTQILILPSRNLCYNTCKIINKDLCAMKWTNDNVIANSNGIKHPYLQTCYFIIVELNQDWIEISPSFFAYKVGFLFMYHMINWHLSSLERRSNPICSAKVARSDLDASLMAQAEPNARDWSHQDTKSDSNVFLQMK